MRTIIASDIHGITPELRALLAPMGNSSIFLSPWAEDRCPYKNEQEAVEEFLAENGLEKYAKKISETAGSQPALLIGFSVGAASAWLHAASASCNPDSVAYLIYGSRIRDHLNLTPNCKVSAIFAKHEISFEPRKLIDALTRANMLYLSGKGAPLRDAVDRVPKVGAEVSVAEAQAHAKAIGLYLLAVAKVALGDLERIKQVVKVFGMVNATPDFTGHTEIVNGCSDLLVQVLGAKGEHARSAIGVASLPKGFAVEIEAVIEFL